MIKKIYFKKLYLILFVLLTLSLVGCNDKSLIGNTIKTNVVTIPLSDLSQNVKFYEYNDNGVTIRYFAVLGSDSIARTAFDACDVCGGKKGYQQIGNDIHCRNCGRVFSIDALGIQNKGYGCWPSFLPHVVQDGNLLIKVSDIKSSRHRFA